MDKKIKYFDSDFRLLFNEGEIKYTTLFQEDKLILLVMDYLIIVNVFIKEIIIKKKLNSCIYNRIKIDGKNIIIVFDSNFECPILVFEVTQKNNNYNLYNIGVINNKVDDILIYRNNDIFIYRNNIIFVYTNK